mgnify:CR=1 FL=1
MRVDATGPLGYALAPPKVSQKVPDSAVSIASDARLAGHPAGLRRTFAIISHPDAGKTTLTEKLLLFGGAIHVAGAVKARGEARRARSDWMKIEQQRGISVTTSVMHFEYGGAVFNLLDTPGHEDFSEDTYRTLTAVDSAVMVIDAAKGIEARTRKLFEICRLRDVPIITFINKMDREAKDPIELLDEIASTLALDVCPMTWPTGSGQAFKGTYDLAHSRMLVFDNADRSRIGEGRRPEHLEGDRSVEVGVPGRPDLRERRPAEREEPQVERVRDQRPLGRIGEALVERRHLHRRQPLPSCGAERRALRLDVRLRLPHRRAARRRRVRRESAVRARDLDRTVDAHRRRRALVADRRRQRERLREREPEQLLEPQQRHVAVAPRLDHRRPLVVARDARPQQVELRRGALRGKWDIHIRHSGGVRPQFFVIRPAKSGEGRLPSRSLTHL